MNSQRILRSFIVFFCVYLSPLFGIESLSYSVRPVTIKGKFHFEVTLKFKADNQKETYLFLPSEGAGQEKLYHEITHLESLSLNTDVEKTEKRSILKIEHEPNAQLELRYYVKSTHSDDKHWFFRPIIEKSHFLFFGYCFFVIPEMDYNKPAHISIEWKKFPKDWTLANSFGANAHKQKIHIPVSAFLNATFCKGDFILLACGDSDKPICVAIRKGWSFSINHLMELLETIIEGQRDFWKDHQFPFYLITFLNSENHYFAGLALNNAFSVFYKDFQEQSERHWDQLAWLLSHEHFHTWNGLKMQPKDESFTWFTEGFTEFYALKLNRRLNIFSLEKYLELVNGILYEYYSSPVRNAKNEKIDNQFWNDEYYQRLPYVRGFLLALTWDEEIRRLSHDHDSLDDAMRSLFKSVTKSGQPFALKDIQEHVGKYIRKDNATLDIENYILKGKTIPLPDYLFEDVAVIEWSDDLGFNLRLSALTQIIQGVIEGSAAYRAGLRNGQVFLNVEASKDEITVEILTDGLSPKKIQYPKSNKNNLIPQFILLSSEVRSAA